jgi:hypothetical protein
MTSAETQLQRMEKHARCRFGKAATVHVQGLESGGWVGFVRVGNAYPLRVEQSTKKTARALLADALYGCGRKRGAP